MTNKRTRPAYDAGERDQLIGWLDLQRAIIEWKCDGLSDVDAHRAVLPSSPLMTMAGLGTLEPDHRGAFTRRRQQTPPRLDPTIGDLRTQKRAL